MTQELERSTPAEARSWTRALTQEEQTRAPPLLPYGKIGCCANNTAYYCNGTTTPTAKACTGTKVCGWDTSASYYDCVAAPGGADPSGTNPIACQ